MNTLKILAVGLAGIALSGCGGEGAIAELPRLREVTDRCPEGASSAAFVALDARGALRGDELTAARLEAIEHVATIVAVCGGGRLKVVAFGPSPAATVTVFDDALQPRGATENARLLHVPPLVSDVLNKIEQDLPTAFRRLTPNGADAVAQLRTAGDFAQELDEGSALAVLIQTSGTTKLSQPPPIEHARIVNVPDLSGLRVTFAGLGRVGPGPPPSTEQIDALRSYFELVCERTNADCRVVTDIVVRG